jgi:hypothetical protein
MRRQPSKPSIDIEWTKVSTKQPCVVCAGHAGCLRGVDDEFACCSRVASAWPLSAGGWVHRVASEAAVEAGTNGDGRRQDHALAMNVAS